MRWRWWLESQEEGERVQEKCEAETSFDVIVEQREATKNKKKTKKKN